MADHRVEGHGRRVRIGAARRLNIIRDVVMRIGEGFDDKLNIVFLPEFPRKSLHQEVSPFSGEAG